MAKIGEALIDSSLSVPQRSSRCRLEKMCVLLVKWRRSPVVIPGVIHERIFSCHSASSRDRDQGSESSPPNTTRYTFIPTFVSVCATDCIGEGTYVRVVPRGTLDFASSPFLFTDSLLESFDDTGGMYGTLYSLSQLDAHSLGSTCMRGFGSALNMLVVSVS